MHDRLRDALNAHATELSQRVLDRMYENPFWMERYGHRGRQFADQDSLYHLQYLDAALAGDDARVFEKYACWLRSVLVSRGMCSEHLAEHFRLLAAEVEARHLPSAAVAAAILDHGVQSLIYTTGEPGRIEQQRLTLQAAVDGAEGAATMRSDDRRYLVSYLIGATASGQRSSYELFAARCHPAVVRALDAAVKAL